MLKVCRGQPVLAIVTRSVCLVYNTLNRWIKTQVIIELTCELLGILHVIDEISYLK
jgi:hypothetical protein